MIFKPSVNFRQLLGGQRRGGFWRVDAIGQTLDTLFHLHHPAAPSASSSPGSA
jgi:hypothetical protein